ncbi:putative ankyrin repeat domain-containing protein 19 [Eulemur rufifrons]|uniref:putative ankyrin repeat domain-containing protein 19 n=1 Tax=Eulemur rufifrons TaxID=859984 RepID=UPI00374447FA
MDLCANLSRCAWVSAGTHSGLLNKTDKNRTALHLACAKGYAQVVTFLLDRKCELNPCDGDNRTPLKKAVLAKECVIMLLERGADPHVVDACSNTARHCAAFNSDLSIAAKLRSHGATMETTNKAKITPPLFVKVAEFLIKEKANVNVVDGMQRTPLMLAIRCGSSIVSLIVQQNIDIFVKDYLDQTAEDYTVTTSYHMFHKQILEYKEKMKATNPPQNSDPGSHHIAQAGVQCLGSGEASVAPGRSNNKQTASAVPLGQAATGAKGASRSRVLDT